MPDEPLHGPAAAHELAGQVVEEPRVGGARAEATKVVRRGDQAAAQQVVPHAVRHDPRGERDRGGHEGVCELEPSAAPGVERGGVDSLEEAPGHRARRAAVVAM